MARRKRIPYDPPSARKKRRRPSPVLRADQIFMSRRMLLVKGVVVGAFTALAGRLGYMQVAQGETYRARAQGNVRRPQILKAPRGMILDRAGVPLAENRRSWEVRIIPSELPTAEDERRRVLDTIIDTLRLPDTLVVDPKDVPRGAEATVYGRVATLLGDSDTEWWVNYITQQARINYLVRVKRSLTPDEAAKFRAASPELPGVMVMNMLEYEIRNAGDPRRSVVVKRDVSRDIALKLEANRLYLQGVELDDSALVRSYPGGEVMSHLLGYVAGISEEEHEAERNRTRSGQPLYELDDIIGKDGLERTMEEMLRGHKGSRWVEVDSNQVQVRTVPDSEIPPVPGRNLKLTIDLEFQKAVSEALQEGIQAANEAMQVTNQEREAEGKVLRTLSRAGCVVAIDPRNGEVLTMVSFPHYDNQLFVDGISHRKWDEYQDPEFGEPYLNRAVMEKYPPGSTFKLYIAASALNRGTLTTATTYSCRGAIRVPHTWNEADGNNYPCWLTDGGHGTLDVYGAIEHSCDVFFYNVGTPAQQTADMVEPLHYYDYNWNTQRVIGSNPHYFEGLGIDAIYEDMKHQFLFGSATGIDLPLETPGLVPNPAWRYENYGEFWSSGDTINVSIGQGYFESTPLQVALNTAVIANGGTVYKPMLVREIVNDAKETVQTFEPQVIRKIDIEQQYLDIVIEGMRRVVHEPTGTAHHTAGETKWPLTNPPGEEEIPIAGKTGTAEVGQPDEDGRYDTHAWFTCFAPMDEPEIALAVIIEYGGEGSTFAVPVADKVLRAYFELTGRRPRGEVLRADGAPPATEDTAGSETNGDEEVE